MSTPTGAEGAPATSPIGQLLSTIFVLSIALVPTVLILRSCTKESPSGIESEDPERRAVDAWWIIQDFVKSALKSPSTAEFPTAGHMGVRYLGNKKFEVTSSVDAQNSFGAMMHKKFYCRVRFTSEHWVNEELRWIE